MEIHKDQTSKDNAVMKFKWITEIEAIDPQTGELKRWCGPNVPGITKQDARRYCDENGLGYCNIAGRLVSEIPCKKGTHEPDWGKQVDYDQIRSN